MNNFLFRVFIVVTAILSFTAVAAGAAEITLEGDVISVNGVDDNEGLGAFSIVLAYGGNVSIVSVEGDSGFLVASNIQNEKYETLIAGISGEGITGDIPVALITKTGTGDIEIFVRELVNAKGDSIPFTNPVYEEEVPDSPSEEIIPTQQSVTLSPEEDATPTPDITTKPSPVPTGVALDTSVVTSEPMETIETTSSSTDNGVQVVPETETEVPQTQSPLGIIVVLIAIGSVFIFIKEK